MFKYYVISVAIITSFLLNLIFVEHPDHNTETGGFILGLLLEVPFLLVWKYWGFWREFQWKGFKQHGWEVKEIMQREIINGFMFAWRVRRRIRTFLGMERRERWIVVDVEMASPRVDERRINEEGEEVDFETAETVVELPAQHHYHTNSFIHEEPPAYDLNVELDVRPDI